MESLHLPRHPSAAVMLMGMIEGTSCTLTIVCRQLNACSTVFLSNQFLKNSHVLYHQGLMWWLMPLRQYLYMQKPDAIHLRSHPMFIACYGPTVLVLFRAYSSYHVEGPTVSTGYLCSPLPNPPHDFPLSQPDSLILSKCWYPPTRLHGIMTIRPQYCLHTSVSRRTNWWFMFILWAFFI